MAFPEPPFSYVTWKLVTDRANTALPGPTTEWVPAAGSVVSLEPSITRALVYTDPVSQVLTTIIPHKVVGVIDSRGYLCHKDSSVPTKDDSPDWGTWVGQPLLVVATDDPNLSVSGWTWVARLASNARSVDVRFATPSGGEVDLSEFVQAPANDDTYAWVSQIPSMIAQAAVLEDRIIALVPLVTQATEAAQTAVQAAQDAAEILESFLELVGDTPPDQP